MKKIILYSLLSFALFGGCKKDETLIDGLRPEERITEAVTTYANALTGSAHGWKAFLFTDGGGGYSFYLNFNKENKVTMYADLAPGSSEVSMESTYRVKALQNPTLSFDTYSYLHILADPNPNTFGGVAGWGLYSDFEFTFDKVVGDSIMLTGKLLNSKLVLVKATQAEKASYDAKGLFNSISTSIDYVDNSDYLYVLLGDQTQVQTTLDYANKIFTLTWDKNGEVNTTSTGFAFTLTGIILKEPIFYNNKKITELTWDPVKNVFFTMVDGVRVEIQNSITPILPLHLVLGVNYSRIVIPNATSYPGWGTEFVSRRALAAAATLGSPYGLRLDRMTCIFNTINKTMTLSVDIYQGANRFIADFPYTFTKTTDGVYKFTASSPTGNAALIVNEMAPLTTQRLNSNRFTLEYFTHPTTGALLGKFISVENPNFTFTGALQ